MANADRPLRRPQLHLQIPDRTQRPRPTLLVPARAQLQLENYGRPQVGIDQEPAPYSPLLQALPIAAGVTTRAASIRTAAVMDSTQATPQSGAPTHVTSRPSPFPPADQIPLHRNPPLAPSQELAYRAKCIELRRRITEIEKNNDETRARIAAEKNFHQKMRLNRAILLDHLREIMEAKGGKPVTMEQLKTMLGPEVTEDPTEDLNYEQLQSNSKKRRRIAPADEEMLDDYSTATDEEDPEPVERPIRARRADNSQLPRDVLMGNTGAAQTPLNLSSNSATNPSAMYYSGTSGLPSLAPAAAAAASFSSSTSKNPTMLTSSFPVQPGSFFANTNQGVTTEHHSPPSNYAQAPQPVPVRPEPPYAQFTEHMRPQLLRDSYPTELIDERISEEWGKLSVENKKLWEDRYNEQMFEYEAQMDDHKKWNRHGRK